MDTTGFTAAQVNMLSQRLTYRPLGRVADMKRAHLRLLRLLSEKIGADRAFALHTEILAAPTFEEANGQVTMVLAETRGDGSPENDPAARPVPKPGKRRAALDQAQTGNLPQAPDFSKPTHARFRAKLVQIVALAEVGDIAGLQAFEINPVSSSPKAMARYRDLCVIAITARAHVAA